MAVTFQNADITCRLTDKSALKKFIAEKFEKETAKKLSVSYIFCSDDYLLQINRDFLKHDFYTDIITFPLSETEQKTEAEIYISAERVSDNASKHKTDKEEEMLRVIFHGVLHLIGYKDKTRPESETMRKTEEKWIRAFEQYKKQTAQS